MDKRAKPSGKFKLNQRHWLNIIILSISLMLLLSLLVGRMLTKSARPIDVNASVTSARLVQLDFGEIQFRRTGSDWTVSDSSYPKDSLLAIANRWQTLLQQSGNVINQPVNSGKTVLVYLSNLEQPVVVKLSLINKELRISFINQKVEFYLPAEELNLYYPQLN